MRNLNIVKRADGSAEINGVTVPAETLERAHELGRSFRLDAAETMILAQQLEHLKSAVYRQKFSELKARSFVPFSNEAGPGAKSVAYRMWGQYVMAKIVSNYATDIPMVTAFAQKFSAEFKSVASGYQYSIQDVREAAQAGINLDAELATPARRAIEQAFDDICAYGVPEANTTGLLNHPNVPLFTLPNGSWAMTTSPDDILEDLTAFAQSVVGVTNEMFAPDTLLLDTDSFGIVSGRIFGDGSRTTILKAFLANNPYIKQVDQWSKLNTADAAGTGPRIVCYKRDPEVMQFEVGQEFEQFPAQAVGLAFKVPCHGRAAGVMMRHPLACAYADNAG